jgi:hypothetical protein
MAGSDLTDRTRTDAGQPTDRFIFNGPHTVFLITNSVSGVVANPVLFVRSESAITDRLT